jgi:hypothetical protein
VHGTLSLFDALHRCMHAIKSPKLDGGRFRKRNDQISDSFPKERLQFAQVTLTGLQLVLQELVSAQQPHLIPNLTEEHIDFQIKSWLHLLKRLDSDINNHARYEEHRSKGENEAGDVGAAAVQGSKDARGVEHAAHALLEVNRRKNLEKEEAAQQKKKELAEAIAFQKEAAKSKDGRRALSKLSHTTVGF